MKIKTAEQILTEEYEIQNDWSTVPIKAMQRYAAQFIDLAAEEAEVEDYYPNPYVDENTVRVDKKTILNIKKQIK